MLFWGRIVVPTGSAVNKSHAGVGSKGRQYPTFVFQLLAVTVAGLQFVLLALRAWLAGLSLFRCLGLEYFFDGMGVNYASDIPFEIAAQCYSKACVCLCGTLN